MKIRNSNGTLLTHMRDIALINYLGMNLTDSMISKVRTSIFHGNDECYSEIGFDNTADIKYLMGIKFSLNVSVYENRSYEDIKVEYEALRKKYEEFNHQMWEIYNLVSAGIMNDEIKNQLMTFHKLQDLLTIIYNKIHYPSLFVSSHGGKKLIETPPGEVLMKTLL